MAQNKIKTLLHVNSTMLRIYTTYHQNQIYHNLTTKYVIYYYILLPNLIVFGSIIPNYQLFLHPPIMDYVNNIPTFMRLISLKLYK